MAVLNIWSVNVLLIKRAIATVTTYYVSELMEI